MKRKLARLTLQQRVFLAILAVAAAGIFACGGCCGFGVIVTAALAIGG
jgi:hypothetical protein